MARMPTMDITAVGWVMVTRTLMVSCPVTVTVAG
jgi:hypothetical protein